MKLLKSVAVACVLIGTTWSPARAVTKYWDINGATAGASAGTTAAGTLDTGTTANWTTDSTGASATTTWTASDDAIFSAGGNATGSFSVTPSAAPVASSITIEEGHITIAGSSAVNINGGSVLIKSGAELITN